MFNKDYNPAASKLKLRAKQLFQMFFFKMMYVI